MTDRLARAIPLGLVLSFALAGAVLAGGWADVKVDGAATIKPVAGTPVTVGFTVLQHGVTPAGWVHATFIVANPATGERHEAAATPSGPDGHFTATITIPSPGFWTWQVTTQELLVDAPPVAIQVRSASGTAPTFDPATTLTAIEQAKRDVIAEINTDYAQRLDTVDSSITGLNVTTANLENKVDWLTKERDALAARVAAAESGSGSIPPLGVVLLAVLAGATAGFAMSWLAGRPGPNVSLSPTRQGSDPA